MPVPRPKRLLKRGVVRLGRAFAASGTRRVVLCYHAITPDDSFLSTKPDLFERHMQWLRERCRVVPLQNILHEQESSTPLVAVTFDDGYEDQHSRALEILTRLGIPATFFLTAGFLRREPAVMKRMAMLRGAPELEVRPLDWIQVREVASAGMQVGSHTYSHPNLARLPLPEARDELTRSREVIEGELGEEVDTIAYPFGKRRVHATPQTLRIAEASGYRIGVSVLSREVRSADSPLTIPRFIVDGDDGRKLQDKITGAYDLIGVWQERAPLWAMRLLSPDDFGR